MVAEIYRPDQWQSFFIMVGGASAALTGLVFVAMSLSLGSTIRDPTHRYRSIGTLAGFTAVFMICALALLGSQTHLSLGGEWLVIAVIAGYIYVNGYRQAVMRGGSPAGLSVYRVVAGGVCYFGQIVGSIMLVFGQIFGLYLAAAAMIVYFPLMISGAWLLIVRPYEASDGTVASKHDGN